jgi:tRNA(adenine34) deaminase
MDCPFPKQYPSQLQRDDAFFMSLAYNQAVDAFRAAEVPVGAVAVLAGEVIGAAHNAVLQTGDPTAHAEMLAITQATRVLGDYRLNAVTLFATKEPCPMCAGATIMARVGRVVYGVGDPKMGGMGGALDIPAVSTLNHHPQVTAGVGEEEARQLLQAFFAQRRGREQA